jgi:DNA gyrase subunit A
MATANGTVKKTALSAFSRPMARGIIAVNLEEGDYLIGVALTDGKHDVMLFSNAGKAVRFSEDEVRSMGRAAGGVRGMRLAEGQRVISLLTSADESLSVLTATEFGYGKRTQIAEYTRHGRGTQGMIAIQTSERNGKVVGATLVSPEDENQGVLTATENGFGKRTPIVEYARHGRGTQGMIAIQTSERNGKVVAAALVSPEDEIMLITSGGVLIRTRVNEIREMGRSTQGVTLINLSEGEKLSGLERVMDRDEENGENGNGNGHAEPAPDEGGSGPAPDEGA